MLSQLLKPPSQQCRCVYIYRGEGAGWRSVTSTVDSLKRFLPDSYDVATLSCQQLLSGSWMAKAALLVMPGGADLPYCKHLNGRGNSLIKDYVSEGGSYLGLCAGAYYAASQVQFEPGSALQVVGDRELGFFRGIARGAAVAGFNYQTEAGAAAVPIQFRVPAKLTEQAHGLNSVQLQGSWCTTCDYCNGGPFFLAGDELLHVEQLPGVSVLAYYCPDPAKEDFWHSGMTSTITSSFCNPGNPKNADSSPRQQRQAAGSSARYTVEDGATAAVTCQDAAPSDIGPGLSPPHQQVIHMVPAAVRCEVADGVVVLCGTHPELEPGWLDVCGNAREGPRGRGVDTSDVGGAAAAARSSSTKSSGRSASGSNCDRTTSSSNDEGGSCAAAESRPSSVGAALTTTSASDIALQNEDSMSTASCGDARLAAHVNALKRKLAECQQSRDLLLSCLLYEVLRRA